MHTAFDDLLECLVPAGRDRAACSARVCLLGRSRPLPVVLGGIGRGVLQVRRVVATDRNPAVRERLVLRIEHADGALRVDVPVEVAACGRLSIVLRILAAPLVLRRRVVRDQALAEALGRPAEPRVA